VYGGHDPGGTVYRDLIQQCRGQVFKQMRIVDADDGVGLGQNGFARRRHQGDRVA
jgi:hypothetical protein